MFLSKKFKLFFTFSILLGINFQLSAAISWVDIKAKKDSFTYKCKNIIKKSKNFVVSELIVPALIKWEEVKEDGLQKDDVVKISAGIGITLGSGFLIKKLNDYYNLREKLKDCKDQIFAHKTKILLSGAGIAAITAGYFLWKKNKVTNDNSKYLNNTLDKFLANLDNEQQSCIINSNILFKLVLNSFENPKLLIESPDFMKLLNDDQKDQLKSIVASC